MAGAAAVLWGAFAAPRARHPVPTPVALAVRALVFGAAALAIAGLGQRPEALGYAGVALVDTAPVTAYRSAAHRRASRPSRD
ncbi:DUF2568 domain-containing protein [Streptomyces sp. NPDC101733]|uniref:DUF2568 domain-containing protein n=1 Tax=unclassified Streptomyces TaxID=2593676 RepID=UPI003824F87C